MFIVVLCLSGKNSMMYTENGGNESKNTMELIIKKEKNMKKKN